MHFPVVLIIPITVMARFFSYGEKDYNQVKDAMYLHGLTNRRLFFHPVKLFEYRMVPLFMVLTKTADDVAVSAMTRGLENPWEKNVYRRKQVLYERLHLFFAYARVDRIFI